MALTKYKEPQTYTPAFNEQVFLYISNQIAIPDFKYVVEVTINSIVYTYNVFQRPDGFMVFDAMDVVKNHISTYFNRDTNNYIATTDKIAVQFKVTEYYSGTLNASSTVNYTVFNACLKTKDFKNYVSTEWYKPLLANYTDFKVFMNETFDAINLDQNVTLNTDYWITFVRGIAIEIPWAIYDENSTMLTSGKITLPAGTDKDILRVNLSPSYIGIIGSTIMQNGYSIEASLNSSGGSLADIFIPKINEVCTKYEVFRLYFLKRNGAIGYKTFEKSSEQKISKKQNEVRIDPSTVYASGGGYDYGRRADQHYSNVVSTVNEYSITLNTDWITQDQSILLDELFDSPLVWLQNDVDGSIQAVSIKDNSYTYKKHENETLFNYSVTVDIDVNESRQKGI